MQVAATGVSVGASGLLLALGLGLLCDAKQRDVRDDGCARSIAARSELNWRTDAARRELANARLHDEIRVQDDDLAHARQLAVAALARRAESPEVRFDSAPDATEDAPAELDVRNADASDADLASIRVATLTGDMAKIRAAVASHNARGLEPVYLSDDPELARQGIAVRASYDRRNPNFAVILEATGDVTKPCTVLVAPGSIVKAGRSGDQDTAPIQARFLKITPNTRAEATATICCAQIHSNDPRGGGAKGLTRHADPRVGLVAATAERERADWGSAQVAIWAVANNVTADEVTSAPGNYGLYIDGARDVLEKAGIDSNKLPLYSHANPRNRAAFGEELLGRLHLMGG
jgi:hypothetical protein